MHWTVCIEGGLQRVNHAAAAVGIFIYSFGGYSSANVLHFRSTQEPIDTHVFNTVSLSWKMLSPPNSGTMFMRMCPFQRYGHTVVNYKNIIYLWGGRNDSKSCNKLFSFDPETNFWSRLKTYGTIPSARDGHSACVIDGKMYIFGGFEDMFEKYSQDLYALDFKTMQWTYIVTQGDCPIYRDFHTGTAVDTRMYIFGGRSDEFGAHNTNSETYPNTLHYLDTTTMTWVKPQVVGDIPCGRRSHSTFVHEGQLYVFGGYNGTVNVHYNDLHMFCPKLGQWKLIKACGTPPSARRRQAAVVLNNKLFLFGGTSPYSSFPNDIHIPVSFDVRLADHDDVYILDFSPSLKTLSLVAVIKYEIQPINLPAELLWDLKIRAKRSLKSES